MVQLKEKTLEELKKMASKKKIEGRSKMNKAQLVRALSKTSKKKMVGGGLTETEIDDMVSYTTGERPSGLPPMQLLYGFSGKSTTVINSVRRLVNNVNNIKRILIIYKEGAENKKYVIDINDPNINFLPTSTTLKINGILKSENIYNPDIHGEIVQ